MFRIANGQFTMLIAQTMTHDLKINFRGDRDFSRRTRGWKGKDGAVESSHCSLRGKWGREWWGRTSEAGNCAVVGRLGIIFFYMIKMGHWVTGSGRNCSAHMSHTAMLQGTLSLLHPTYHSQTIQHKDQAFPVHTSICCNTHMFHTAMFSGCHCVNGFPFLALPYIIQYSPPQQ